MYEVILSIILSKTDFNLIKEKKIDNKVFHIGEIRIGWQYDEKNNVYWKYQERSRILQQNCLSGFR
jgi:hypothetical protein